MLEWAVVCLCEMLITFVSVASTGKSSCHYDLGVMWVWEVDASSIVASPIVVDMNADGINDILVASFNGKVVALSGDSGLPLVGWPVNLDAHTFHSSPLVHDIDKDGDPEVILATSNAVVLVIDIRKNSVQVLTEIPRLLVKQNWYQDYISADFSTVGNLVQVASGEHVPQDSVAVDAHVLATPIIADVNNDGETEEMVIPVSYYFEDGSFENGEKFVASAIVILNTTSGQLLRHFVLELSQKNNDYAPFVVSSPTLVDLDGDGSALEILIGTLAGYVHALNENGTQRRGFPLSMGAVHCQVAVAEIDTQLFVLVADASGNVQSMSADGKVVWEQQISTVSTPGIRVVQNSDLQYDVVLAGADGKVWRINSKTGKLCAGFPLDVRGQVLGSVLTYGQRGFVVTTYKGEMFVVSEKGDCWDTLLLNENVFVQTVSAELDTEREGLELIVATASGLIMAIGERTRNGSRQEMCETWTSECRFHNQFVTYNTSTFSLKVNSPRPNTEIRCSKNFLLDLIVKLPAFYSSSKKFAKIAVKIGNIRLMDDYDVTKSGVYLLTVNCPQHISKASLSVRLYSVHKIFLCEKSIPLVFESPPHIFGKMIAVVIFVTIAVSYFMYPCKRRRHVKFV